MKYKGLTEKEVKENLKTYGKNELELKNKTTIWAVLLSQLKSIFVPILLIAMLLSLIVNKQANAVVILITLSLIILLGFIQEYKAGKEMDALKNMVTFNSIVIRNGVEKEIDSTLIVPGDILVLRAGDKIPADSIILEQKDLKVNESILTGESVSVEKHSYKGDDLLVAEKTHKIYMGTYVTSGNALAQIIHTGKNTEFGKIAAMISDAKQEKNPIETQISKLVIKLSTLSILTAFFTLIISLFRMSLSIENIVEALIISVALLVSGIPEGLPVVNTISLASGMKKMAKKNAIVNKMNVIQSLGCVNFICSDKTGTLTKNEMTVKKIFFNNTHYNVTGAGYNTNGIITELNSKKEIDEHTKNKMKKLFQCMILCNDSKIYDSNIEENKKHDSIRDFTYIGTPTEAALLVLCAKENLYKENQDQIHERIEEIPFSSDRKYMVTLHNYNEQNISFSKGALDVLIKKCNKILINDKEINFSDSLKKEILEKADEFSSQSLRVIGFSYKYQDKKNKQIDDKNYVFLGFAGIIDPPKEGILEALRECRSASINVMMITGDHLTTAKAIAKDINLDINKKMILTGSDIDEITDDELEDIVDEIAICARAKPEHKMRIVSALQQRNNIVAMTGDGVNDAPALKKANVGIAMGISGTDVTKESGDIILKDDHFSTIVNAVSEGRHMFRNIQKFISYQFGCNIAQIMAVFLAILSNIPSPLTALQILYMNLVTDDLPAIALSLNPKSKDIMKEKPRNKYAKLISKPFFVLMIFSSVLMIIGTLGSFFFFYLNGVSLEYSRTIALSIMIFAQVFFAYNFRSIRKTTFEINPLKNKFLIYASVISLLSLIVIINIPFLASIFYVTQIKALDYVLIVGISLILLITLDLFKKFYVIPLQKKIDY